MVFLYFRIFFNANRKSKNIDSFGIPKQNFQALERLIVLVKKSKIEKNDIDIHNSFITQDIFSIVMRKL